VTAVRIATIVAALALGALPGGATPPQFLIMIENASPYFSPKVASVEAGTPIRWDNPTPTEHTITHDGCVTDGTCAFDSDTMLPNAHYSIAGLPPGQYPYHCRVHPIMRGLLTVTESSAPPQI
jgi:plastocyanin